MHQILDAQSCMRVLYKVCMTEKATTSDWLVALPTLLSFIDGVIIDAWLAVYEHIPGL